MRFGPECREEELTRGGWIYGCSRKQAREGTDVVDRSAVALGAIVDRLDDSEFLRDPKAHFEEKSLGGSRCATSDVFHADMGIERNINEKCSS